MRASFGSSIGKMPAFGAFGTYGTADASGFDPAAFNFAKQSNFDTPTTSGGIGKIASDIFKWLGTKNAEGKTNLDVAAGLVKQYGPDVAAAIGNVTSQKNKNSDQLMAKLIKLQGQYATTTSASKKIKLGYEIQAQKALIAQVKQTESGALLAAMGPGAAQANALPGGGTQTTAIPWGPVLGIGAVVILLLGGGALLLTQQKGGGK